MTITPQDKQHALAVVGSRRIANLAPDINEITAYSIRLASLLTYKGSEKLTDQERFALAAAALMYDLNPAMNEVWYIPSIGLMVGRNGWTKKLNEYAAEVGFTWWPQYELLQHSEYDTYQVPGDCITAWKCSIRRSDTLDVYMTSLERMSAGGLRLDHDSIIAMLGTPPVTIGVGYITKAEFDGNPSKGQHGLKTTKMNLAERAKKRAFRDCCSQMIHIPIAQIPDGMVVDGRIVDDIEDDFVQLAPDLDSEFVDSHSPQSPAQAYSKPAAQAASKTLYGGGRNPEKLHMDIQNKIESNRKISDHDQPYAKGSSGKLVGKLDQLCGGAAERHMVLHYLTGSQSSKQWDNATGRALYDWAFNVNEAAEEAQSILASFGENDPDYEPIPNDKDDMPF